MRLRRLLVGSIAAIALSTSAVATQGTTTSAASPSLPPCSRLVIAAGTPEGGLGTGTLVILLANAGKRCEIAGYPRVQLFTIHGAAMHASNLHKSSMFYAEPRPRTVVLPHNGVASAGLSWGDNPVGDQTCVRAAWATIALPDGVTVQANSPSVSATPCGGYLLVTAIELGPTPAPNG
jgi:hypothetical protein